MGPDNSSPVRLFFVDPETGEQQEISDHIAELSITETGSDEAMSAFFRCRDCEHADCKRTQDTKIRCKRWSRWVEPNERACEEHNIFFPLYFDPVQQAEMMKYFQRKQRG